jgi:hypothetical protein
MTSPNSPADKENMKPEHADFDVNGHMHDCLFDEHDVNPECTKDCAAWLYALWTDDMHRQKAHDAVVAREARIDELEQLEYVDWGDDLNPIVDDLIEKHTAQRKQELEQLTTKEKQ